MLRPRQIDDVRVEETANTPTMNPHGPKRGEDYLEVAKQDDQAVAAYRKVLDADPKVAVAINNLAWMLCSKGDLQEALKLAREARRLDGHNPQFADTLGWIYYKLNSQTLAVDQLLFSVNTGKPKAENYYRLGMAYFAKGDVMLARQTLRKALAMTGSFDGASEARSVLQKLN